MREALSPQTIILLILHLSNQAVDALASAPKRLPKNSDGVLFVNDRCIDCTTCANFAPDVFARDTKIWKHYVHTQPDGEDIEQLERARAALVACPVSAIRLETTRTGGNVAADGETSSYVKKLVPTRTEFPRLMLQVPATKGEVWYVGRHSKDTFGATPYIARGADGTTVLVDTPRFSVDAARAIESICGTSTGPDYHLITHVDDSAGHLEWQERYSGMRRIFHSGDLGDHNWRRDNSLEDVEVLLEEKTRFNKDGTIILQAWTLDGKDLSSPVSESETQNLPEFIVYHTPGHSPGSISLLFQEDVLFTGDTLAYSAREKAMSGFPRYGHDLNQQSQIIEALLDLSWRAIAPGHGSSRIYEGEYDFTRKQEVGEAAKKLLLH